MTSIKVNSKDKGRCKVTTVGTHPVHLQCVLTAFFKETKKSNNLHTNNYLKKKKLLHKSLVYIQKKVVT